MRYFATAILAVSMALCAMAQNNRIYIEDFEIDPDSTVTVPVILANESPTRGVQFNMTLPPGLILKSSKVTDYSSEYFMSMTCRYYEKGGYYMVFIFPMAAVCFEPNTAEVMTITFAAQPDFKGGTISLWNCMGSTINNHSFAIDGASTVVTVPEASLIGIPIDKDPERDEFFNLLGQPVSSPDSVSLAIHVTTAADGQRTSRKVSCRH